VALHFHPLTVKDIQRETSDAVSITFDIPRKLQKEFAFKQGQNITLKKILMAKTYVAAILFAVVRLIMN
jgi:ring-1,2-phenylacetyl-CoA epoxidase subunit PaaE